MFIGIQFLIVADHSEVVTFYVKNPCPSLYYSENYYDYMLLQLLLPSSYYVVIAVTKQRCCHMCLDCDSHSEGALKTCPSQCLCTAVFALVCLRLPGKWQDHERQLTWNPQMCHLKTEGDRDDLRLVLTLIDWTLWLRFSQTKYLHTS